MKRSASVTLMFLSLLGCDDNVASRDVYRTREECVRDWGDAQQCEEASHHGQGYYYGPHYHSHGGNTVFLHDGSPYYRPSNNAVQSVRPSQQSSSSYSSGVTRGGFGSTGHGMSSGG